MDLAGQSTAMIQVRTEGFDGSSMLRLLRWTVGNALGFVGLAAGILGWLLYAFVLLAAGLLHMLWPVALSGVNLPHSKTLAGWWRAWRIGERSEGFRESDAIFAVNVCIGTLYGHEAVRFIELSRRVQQQRSRNMEIDAEFRRIGATVQCCDPLDSVVLKLSEELGPYVREQSGGSTLDGGHAQNDDSAWNRSA